MKCNPVDADDARAAVRAKFVQSLGQTAIPPVGSTDGTLKGNPADADDARFAAAKSVSSLGGTAPSAYWFKGQAGDRRQSLKESPAYASDARSAVPLLPSNHWVELLSLVWVQRLGHRRVRLKRKSS